MLAAKYRIPADKIPLVARKGRRKHHPLLTIVQFTDSSLTFPHFAFVISIKIEKTAVGRNRIKRRLRATVYALLDSGIFNASTNYMLLVRDKSISELPQEKLEELVKDLV